MRLLTVFFFSFFTLLATAHAENFVLIRNAANKQTTITIPQLRRTLLGQNKTWPSGDAIQIILNKKGSPETQWLAEQVFGIPESVFRSKMAQEVLAGNLKKPIIADNPLQVMKEVQHTVGALGILSESLCREMNQELAILEIIR